MYHLNVIRDMPTDDLIEAYRGLADRRHAGGTGAARRGPVAPRAAAGGLMSDLTKNQIAVLRGAEGGSSLTRAQLIHRMGYRGAPEGLNQTLGSLVRRGLLYRVAGRPVMWGLTAKGDAARRSYR